MVISGFNVAIVSGFFYFLIRWLWVAIPGAALRWPAQKAGLLGSAGAAIIYALLAGWDSPVQLDARTALEPTTVAGEEIDVDTRVVTLLGAANRDPDQFSDPDRFDVGLSYTWLDASNPDGTVEVRRPEHEALLQLGYRMPNDRTRINLDLRHVAGNHDSDFTSPAFGARTVRLSDYTLVNLRLSHDITDSTRLTAGIYNLTDARYEELDGYATQGRTVFFGATSRF